jgi:hypothetical protein
MARRMADNRIRRRADGFHVILLSLAGEQGGSSDVIYVLNGMSSPPNYSRDQIAKYRKLPGTARELRFSEFGFLIKVSMNGALIANYMV